MSSDAQNRSYIGYLLCVLCFGLTIWAFYPGLMTADSIAGLTEGRQNSYSDILSPLMSYLWGIFDRILEGPGLMLIFQNLIFWSACAFFWRATHKKSFWLGLALILFGFLPQIISQLPFIWKDIGLGASLFLAVALVCLADKEKSKTALLISPLFLFYGFAVRLNAFPAILPLAIWSGFVFCRIFEINKRKFVPVLVGIVYLIALSVVVSIVNGRLTEGKTVHPFQQIYLYDLAAISTARDEALFPEYILRDENFSLEKVKTRYNKYSVSDLIFPNLPKEGDVPVLRLTNDAEEVTILRQKWLETVAENPATYLWHRIKIFAQLNGVAYSTGPPTWQVGFSNNPPEYRREENIGYQIFIKYLKIFRRPFPQTFGYRSVIWFLLCGIFIYKAVRRRLNGDWEIVFVLSISSILYALAYFPTAPSTEFRYLFWSAIASAVAIIFGVYLSWKERKVSVARA